jgi:tetratricopeptide (TPR) repeat protein
MALSSSAAARQDQAPWKGKNLQFFPQDIAREVLVQRMREFSFALNVRCQYCHSGGDGISFDGVDFASDAKPAKMKARAMLRMTDQVNRTLLPQVPSRAEPRVQVDCATCHHGLALPKTLQTTLYEIVKKDGAAAAVARYRELRNGDTLAGRYNFGEWEINELARRLIGAGNTQAAIAILEMNGEYYPQSASIDTQLGSLFEATDTAKALQHYNQAILKDPKNQFAKNRIAALEKQ